MRRLDHRGVTAAALAWAAVGVADLTDVLAGLPPGPRMTVRHVVLGVAIGVAVWTLLRPRLRSADESFRLGYLEGQIAASEGTDGGRLLQLAPRAGR
jgi:hypothetical protein